MKTIKLYGILAKKFGKEFTLDVQSPKEACHALACQVPEFRLFMLKSERFGYKFAVFCGKQRAKDNIGEQQLDNITSQEIIHIVPKIIGAGGKAMGWLQVVAGVVLIGAGMLGFGGPATIGIGVGLLVGGITTLLMPTPQGQEPNNPDGNRPNYGFGGAVTTVAQGSAVPILYGERDVGGFICSAGIYTQDV